MSHAKGRGAWALVSLAGIAVSCLGAILLPYFDILAAIMGALGNLVAAYALPALFVLVRMHSTCTMSHQACYVTSIPFAQHTWADANALFRIRQEAACTFLGKVCTLCLNNVGSGGWPSDNKLHGAELSEMPHYVCVACFKMPMYVHCVSVHEPTVFFTQCC